MGDTVEQSMKSGFARSASSVSRTEDDIAPQKSGEDGGAGASSLLDKETTLSASIYGLIYTVTKERDAVPAWASIIVLILDWIQIQLITVNAKHKWAINWDNILIKWVLRLNLAIPLVEFGYNAFIICFYILVATLIGTASLGAFVAWNEKTKTFPFTWPNGLLRFLAFTLLLGFYQSVLNIFLTPPNCNFLRDHEVDGLIYAKMESDRFLGVKCLAFPHIVAFATGLVSACLAAIMSLMLAMFSSTDDLHDPNLLASTHAAAEVRLWLCRTSLAIFCNLLGYEKAQGWFVICVFTYMNYVWLRWAPALSVFMNTARSGLYFVLWWISAMYLALNYKPDDPAYLNFATDAALYGAPLFFLLGVLAMRFRLYLSQRHAHAFYGMTASSYEAGIIRPKHKFWNEYEVEIVARFALQQRTETGEPHAEWLDAAEVILKDGVKKRPDSAFLSLLYANFLFSVRANFRGGKAQLTRARKLKMGWVEHFIIFSRERESKTKGSADGSGDSALDLVTYVEFQSSLKSVTQAHMEALRNIRQFWRELLVNDVSFASLTKTCLDMETAEKQADKVYQLLLDRYPKSPKLARHYSSFLMDVKGDPWAANKYFNEAEKLEEEQSSLSGLLGQTGTMDDGNVVNEATDAVIIINDMGIIQFTNRVLNKMFGYKKGELAGKNVSVLIPVPFSTEHDSYLRRFKVTQRSKYVINQERSLIGLHKARHIVPVTLRVTTMSQNEAQCFLGVFRACTEEADKAQLYLTATGQILTSDRVFEDFFGFSCQELTGRNFRNMADDSEIDKHLKCLHDLATDPNNGDEEQTNSIFLETTSVYDFSATMRHKYGGSIRVSIMTVLCGTSATASKLLHLKIKPVDTGSAGCIAVESTGIITYASSSVETMLGYTKGTLLQGKFPLSKILPAPFNSLHQKCVEDWSKKTSAGESTHSAVSCVSKPVALLHRTGRGVPVRLSISTVVEDGRTIYATSIDPYEYESPWGNEARQELAMAGARLRLLIGMDGEILACDAPVDHPHVGPGQASTGTFGYSRSALIGASVVELVDMFSGALEQSRMFGQGSSADRVLPPLLKRMAYMVEDEDKFSSWRVGIRPGPNSPFFAEGYLPARMVVAQREVSAIVMERMVECGLVIDPEIVSDLVTQGGALIVDIYAANGLQGLLEIDKDGSIKRANKSAALLLGHPNEFLRYANMNQLFTSPPSKISTGLGVRLGNTVGTRVTVGLAHADGSLLSLSALFCTKDDSGARLQGFLSEPFEVSREPIGSFRRIQDLVFNRNNGAMMASQPMPSHLATSSMTQEGRGSGAWTPSAVGDARPPMGGRKRAGFAVPDDGGDAPDSAGGYQQNRRGSVEAGPARRGSNDPYRHGGDADGAKSRRGSVEPHAAAAAAAQMVAAGREPSGNGGIMEAAAPGSRRVSEAGGDRRGSDGDTIDQNTDIRRARRGDKLRRLLTSREAQRSVLWLQRFARVASVIILIYHLASFLFLRAEGNSIWTQLTGIDDIGNILGSMQRAGMYSRMLYRGYNPVEPFETVTDLQVLLEDQVDRFDKASLNFYRAVFKGSKTETANAMELTVDIPLSVLTFSEVPGTNLSRYENFEGPLMESVREFSRAARTAARSPDFPGRIEAQWARRYVRDNVPESLYEQIRQAVELFWLPQILNSLSVKVRNTTILSTIEGAFLLPLITIVMYFSMKVVKAQRLRLFSIFLQIPRPIINNLASRELRVGEDDSDVEGDDDDDVALPAAQNNQGQAQPQQITRRSSLATADKGSHGVKIKVSSTAAAKRQLRDGRFSWKILRIMAPLCIYIALLIITVDTSMIVLKGLADPVKALEESERFKHLSERVQVFSYEVFVTTNPFDKGAARIRLDDAIAQSRASYQSLLYGSTGSNARKDAKTRGVLATPKYQNLLFGSGCLRALTSPPCPGKDSPYYPFVTRGLNTLIDRYLTEAYSLYNATDVQLLDPAANATLAFILEVGHYDLFDGLVRFGGMLLSDARLAADAVAIQEIVIMVLVIIVVIINAFALRPIISAVIGEARRAARLLALVPAEVDPEKLVYSAGFFIGKEDQDDDEEDEKNAADGTARRRSGLLAKIIPGAGGKNQVADYQTMMMAQVAANPAMMSRFAFPQQLQNGGGSQGFNIQVRAGGSNGHRMSGA